MSNKIPSTSHSNKVSGASHSNNVSSTSFSNKTAPKGNLPGTARPFTKLVSVFIDNSSILFEGQYTVGRIVHASAYDRRRRSVYLNELKIDYGRLLSRVLRGREMSNNPTIVGIQPPKMDSLWNYVQSLGYKVTYHTINKEKKGSLTFINSTLTIAGMNTIQEKDPGIMIIISSDDSYNPLAKEAIKRGWKVETWFWIKGDYDLTANEKSRHFYNYLSSQYKYFTYACTEGDYHPRNKFVLEIDYSDTPEEFNDKNIMELHFMSELFGWWNRDKIGNIVYLYFDSKKCLEKAKQQILIKYPHKKDTIQLWDVSN
ncbi:unnamed protein product [Rhizophagus irregularis]|uniref:NYN domain-containing protein n=1 Tax=Rhizophagus irregularis TaxID=588596 RepID=A0A2I1HEJ1_9GLOM|nr:hypothetical protein RhiirA4_478211 [Rhizophagus irregularis]CAB4430825.1 unnamed protein product [Rhizophagus irregularis]